MLDLYDLEMMSGGTGRYRSNMPQQQTQQDAFYDSLFSKYREEMEDAVGAPLKVGPKTSTRTQELVRARQDDVRRTDEARRGVHRGGIQEFGRQLIAGTLESATVAPSLWEKLGVPGLQNVPQLIEDVKGEYGHGTMMEDWDELSGIGKAGYGIGTGLGMLVPFGAAGKAVGFGVGTVGRAANLVGKTGWAKKAAVKEITERASKLTGGAAAKLSDDAIRESVDVATKAVGKHGLARQLGERIGSENFEQFAKLDIVSKLGTGVPRATANDLANLAFEAVTTLKPSNAHAFLNATVGKIPGVTGRMLSSYSYDALIGATMGYMRFNAEHWADHMEKTGTEGIGTYGAFKKEREFHDMVGEMGNEAFWIGFLGPVRMIRGGTSGSITAKGVNVARRMWRMRKPVNRMTPREARSSLKIIDDVSEGALKHSNIPVIEKAMRVSDSKSLHWSDLLSEKEVYSALEGIRGQFMRRAPGFFAREWRKDMMGSLPRMLIGATTMNLPAIKQLYDVTGGDIEQTARNLPYTWGESIPEIASNVIVGMVFTKRGRGLRMFDKAPNEGFLQHADADRWVGGQSNILKRMIAGMEKIGYSTKQIRGLSEHQMWDYDQSVRYQKGIRDFNFQNSPTYKRLRAIVDRYSKETEKDIREGDEVMPLVEAFREAVNAESDPVEIERLNADFAVAREIMAELNSYSTKELGVRMVTVDEAKDLVRKLARSKINGREPTKESIVNDLIVLSEQTFNNSVQVPITKQKSYIIRVLKALGYDDAFTVDPKGKIILSGSLSQILRTPKGSSEEASAVYRNIDRLLQDGGRNRWVEHTKKKQKFDKRPSMEQVEEARKIHDEITDEMHRLVYGEDWTREKEGGSFDDFIISDTVFGVVARDNLILRQGRNSVSLLSQKPELVDSSDDLTSVQRTLEDLNTTLSARSIEIRNWDKVSGHDEAMQQEIGLWLTNVKKIHNILNPKPIHKTKEVDALEVVELKKKMDLLTGDTFIDDAAFSHTRKMAIQQSVLSIGGMDGQSASKKVGILSLLTDRLISEDGESLPEYYNIKKFLDMMKESGKIQEAERKELDLWYQNDIEGALKDSDSSIIKLKDTTIVESSQEAWLDALRKSRLDALSAKQSDIGKTIEGIAEKTDNTIDSIAGKFSTFKDAVDPDKALIDHLSNGMDRTNLLKSMIQQALFNKDIDMFKELSEREVSITEALDNLSKMEPGTGYEAYVLALAKELDALNAFDRSRITENEAAEMLDRDVESSTVRVDRETGKEETIRITTAQFSMKYNVSSETLFGLFKFLKDSNQLNTYYESFKSQAPGLFLKADKRHNLTPSEREYLNVYNDLIGLRESYIDKPFEFTPKQIVDQILPSLEMIAKFNSEKKRNLGQIDDSQLADIQKDIFTDSYQLVQSLINSKAVSVLEFRDGVWDLSKTVMSDRDKGYLALESSLPGISGHMYLMSQSARVNRRFHNFLTKDVMAEINRHLSKREITIQSLELEQQFMRSGIDNFTDTGTVEALNRELVDSKRFVNDPYHIIPIDETTSVVVRFNEVTQNAVSAAFSPGSDFYNRVDKGFGLDSNRQMKQVMDEIAGKTNNIKNFERGILFIRLYNDFPTRLENHIDAGGHVDLKSTKKLWKRFVLTQPKSGVYGTDRNIQFALESYRHFRDEGSELHGLALEAMEKSFAAPLKTWVINDDKWSSRPDNDELNPLDVFEIKRAQLDKDVSDGKMTEVERVEVLKDLKSLKGRGAADADWYVTKDRFLSILGLFGIRDSMLVIDENGVITGFRSGAIKPTIHISEVNEDGSMRVFIGKTAFKYDPVVEKVLLDKNVHALTFASAAKIWDTKGAIDNGRVQPTEQDNYQKPPTKTREEMRDAAGEGWRENVIEGMNAEAVIDIPWKDMNFKQVSREHVGSPGPNMFVYFSNRGMEGGKRWLNIVQRLGRFEESFHKMILDPFARTHLARTMMGFSIEAGDNSLARTGLDYMLERGGILMDAWQQPHLERAMISYYLNGGNTSHYPMQSSSMDVMTAEPGWYDTPVRHENGGDINGNFPVQTRFGGKGISSFLGDKTHVQAGYPTVDGQTHDNSQSNSSAFIFDHRWESKEPGQKDVIRTEEGMIFENERGEAIITFRGFQIEKEATGDILIRRLIDMEEGVWNPFPETVLGEGISNIEFNREFFEGVYNDITASTNTYGLLKEAIKSSENEFGWTNTNIEGWLRNMGTDQNLWPAAFSVRQPRNAAGDVVITKVQEVIDQRQGNVEKTNLVDALKHQDADNDMDKNTTFMSAPHTVWSDLARLSGRTVYSDEASVLRTIGDKINENVALLDGDLMRFAQGDVIAGALVRGRFVKMHQTMSYILNMFGSDDAIITGVNAGGKEFRVRVNKNPDAITGTSNFISRWVKVYIDLYNHTPKGELQGTDFVTNKMWDIWFGKGERESLLEYQVKDRDGNYIKEEGDGLLRSDYSAVKEMMKARVFSPIAKFLTYNRGTEQNSDGYKRQASLQQMSSAYRTLMYSLIAPEFNGQKTSQNFAEGGAFKDVSAEPALTRMRDYFAESSNSFDYGMRRLHEIEAKKYADIKHDSDGIGQLIVSIESGEFDTGQYGAKFNSQIQNALHHYVKSEGEMVEIINLERQIQAKQERIDYLNRVYGSSAAESAEGKIETKRMVILKEARDTLVAGVGLHKDFILGKYREAYTPIPHKGEGKDEWTNNRGKPVGVIHKGKLREVILDGRKNYKSIPKNATLIESPRRYVASGEDTMGAWVNLDRFVGPPVLVDKQGEFQKMSHAEWDNTRGVQAELTKRWIEISDRYNIPLSPKEIGARETEKLRAIHDVVNNPQWKVYTENTGILGKWAIIQRMLVPTVSPTDMEISPRIGLSQKADIYPKLTMPLGGTVEKNVLAYLNLIRTGDGFGEGVISKAEADLMLENYVKHKNLGFIARNNKYRDLDVMAEGMFAGDVELSRHHLFRHRLINQEIYAYRESKEKAVKDAANILIKYASGEVLLDPFTLYRATKVMERKNIQSNQIFGEMIREEAAGDFGQSTRMNFIHPLDAASERGRYFGDQSTVDEGVKGMVERIFRCGSK